MSRSRRPTIPGAVTLLLLLLAAGCAPPPPAAPAPSPATTVYVVRHAERASETDRDPTLSEAGRARAAALADSLARSGIAAAYVTEYRRTRETAAPTAERLGVPVHELPAGGPDAIPSLARAVLERHAGESVLVVGHSNTVHAIVRALGGEELPELASSRYGDLFVVTIPADGAPTTTRRRFGVP